MSDWTKNDNPCLESAQDDEPLFVLRAQDELAPTLVREWANDLEAALDPGERDQVAAKVEEARRIASLMEDWQHANGAKLPD